MNEWTEETVLKFYGEEFPTSAEVAIAIEIADAHNAQIAAAYQKGYEDGRMDKNTTE